jgi:ABC-type multidrug transport system permease subunit
MKIPIITPTRVMTDAPRLAILDGGARAASRFGGQMFAYTYPLLSLFWTMLILAGVFLMLFFIVWCFVDNFRRGDHHGWAKFGWTVLILFLPIVGALIYIIARPADA